jgi:hypothetical protein
VIRQVVQRPELHSKDREAKFRTILGKFEASKKSTKGSAIQFLNSSEDELGNVFTPLELNELTCWMGKAVDGNHLKTTARCKPYDKKAPRIAFLPKLSNFQAWLQSDLRVAFEDAVQKSVTSSFDAKMYVAVRNLFLVLLLMVVPRKRLYLEQLLSLDNMDVEAGSRRFSSPNYKTSATYGSAMVLFPSRSTFFCKISQISSSSPQSSRSRVGKT